MVDAPKWLADMPKTDLHCHLGGSMRLSTILEFAEKYGVDIGTTNEKGLRDIIVYKNRKNPSLAGYIKGIALCESVMKKPEAFQRAAYEICEDAAAENVRLLELRFGPTNYVTEDMRLFEIVEAALDGLSLARERLNMQTGLIICGIRTDNGATAKAAQVAAHYCNMGVVGFDIAGKENGHLASQFRQLIMPVLNSFLPVTAHAGEEASIESIKQALIDLNANRIGHGVSLYQNEQVIDYVDKERIGIEICPTSNIDTGCVCDYSLHPIRSYFLRGLRVTVNTDNRTISDTTITKEYMKLMDAFKLTKEQIVTIARHGFKAAFLESTTTRELLKEMDEFKQENGIHTTYN